MGNQMTGRRGGAAIFSLVAVSPTRPLRTMASITAISAVAAAATPALAQETLPEVTVTSPSPIQKRPRAPRRPSAAAPAPASQPAPVAAIANEPVETEAVGDPALAAPAGTLIVVDEAYSSVTVATGRDILAERGATLTDTLQHRPGITGSTFAAGSNRPIIRGLDNTRIRIQENGIGAHDVSTVSEDHAVPFDPFAADRVEVVRGPATLRYGSQAIGGVVSVENERIPTFMPSGGFSGEIKGGLSSVDDGGDGAFKAKAGSAGIVVHADGFKRNAGNYATPQGEQANSFAEAEGFSFGTSYVWKDGFIGVAFSRYDSLYGIPGGEAAERGVKIDLTQDRITTRGEWRVRDYGIEAIRFWFGSSDYKHDEIGAEEDPPFEVVIGSTFPNDEQEARGEIQHLPVGTSLGVLRGALGLQWGNRDLSAAGEGGELLAPNATDTIAGFIFEELEVTEGLRFQAAARIEQAEVDGTAGIFPADFVFGAINGIDEGEDARSRRFTPFSASLGTLIDLPLGVVARLNGQYVERAPDAAELFSKGVHEATETFEIGDPDLREEKAKTVELGFARASGPLRFDTSLYYTKFDGFIFKQLTGNTCSEDEGCAPAAVMTADERPLDQVVFTQRDATFYGLELAVQYDVAPIWRGVWGIEGQYDFVNAEFDGGENVPRIPPHRLGGGFYYRDDALFLRAGLLHAFDQDQIGAGETPTDGYALLSAEGSFTIKLDAADDIAREFTIGVKGENLADDEVRNHVSFKKDDVLLPGANVRLFGSLKFN